MFGRARCSQKERNRGIRIGTNQQQESAFMETINPSRGSYVARKGEPKARRLFRFSIPPILSPLSPIFWPLLFLRNCICFASVAEDSPTSNNSFSSETAASPFHAAQHRPATRFPARPSVSGRAGSPTVNRSSREYTSAQSDQVYCRPPVALNESDWRRYWTKVIVCSWMHLAISRQPEFLKRLNTFPIILDSHASTEFTTTQCADQFLSQVLLLLNSNYVWEIWILPMSTRVH